MLSLNTLDLQCLDHSLLFLCSTTDKQLRLLHTNRLFRDTFGVDEEKEGSASWLEATQVAQREKCIAAARDCLRSPGKTIQAETSVKNNTGEERWFRWEISALVSEDHMVQGLRFVGTETSCQKNSESQLLAMKEKLFSIQARHTSFTNALMEGLLIINARAVIIECNTAAEKILGLSEGELLGKNSSAPDFRCIREDGSDFPGPLRPSFLALQTGKPQRNVTMGIQKPDGSIIWICINAQPVYGSDPGSAPAAVVCSIADITERKKEEERKAKEEANKKQELVEAIIRAQERERQEISFELHDNVNQLLSTGMLVLDVAEDHPQHARDYIRQSKNAIRKAIDEIRKITHSLNPATLGFVGLTASIRDIMKEINPTRKLHISFIPQGLVDEKTIDPAIQLAVFRIIQEQLTNIIRHSGGSNALLKLVRSGDMLQLEIRDNGIGFDIPTTRRGLGLSNIFTRAEHYNGKAVLESAPGEGCLLKVVLPVTVE